MNYTQADMEKLVVDVNALCKGLRPKSRPAKEIREREVTNFFKPYIQGKYVLTSNLFEFYSLRNRPLSVEHLTQLKGLLDNELNAYEVIHSAKKFFEVDEFKTMHSVSPEKFKLSGHGSPLLDLIALLLKEQKLGDEIQNAVEAVCSLEHMQRVNFEKIGIEVVMGHGQWMTVIMTTDTMHHLNRQPNA